MGAGNAPSSLLFRKKLRLLRLCPCKRRHDGSAALPTFYGCVTPSEETPLLVVPSIRMGFFNNSVPPPYPREVTAALSVEKHSLRSVFLLSLAYHFLHFDAGQLPPTEGLGFWSVTAYDSANNFLIDNEIDRYCMNNRSDVELSEDGSLDIYLQAKRPEGDEKTGCL